jgi:hypothetical protein
MTSGWKRTSTEVTVAYMSTAAIVTSVVVIVLIVGGVLSLRASAKIGMPSKDVLDRASRRARKREARNEENGVL